MAKNTLKEFDDEIEYGNAIIPFKVILSKRRTLSIAVYPDMSVRVRAPYRASIKHIKKVVEKKADWIEKKRSKFSALPQIKTTNNYEDGDILMFLGKPLKLQITKDIVNCVDVSDGVLNICVTKIDKSRIKKLIKNWLEQSAKKIFTERVTICKALAAEFGIEHKGALKFRKMRSMWGNCSRRGEIKLSYELVKAPITSIDYVIIHELCHLKEFNHSKKFYALLESILPDWKERKNELKKISSRTL